MTTNHSSGVSGPQSDHADRQALGRPDFPPVLQVGPFPAALQAQLQSLFNLVDEEALASDPSKAASIVGIITRSNCRVPAELIDRLPQLRIISTNGVGYDGIPVAHAAQKGIVVTNTPDVLNKAVAETTIGLLLALLRRIPAADEFVRSGAWEAASFPLGVNLAGKKVGIAGLGRIGKEIVRRLEAFDVEISYFGRRSQPVPWRHFNSITALANHSDVLIVSCPGGADTHHLIDAAVLKALGSSGVIVNIARGSVINEADLCRALADGTIAGAALDVFETEPLGESPLRSLSNVVLTPHIGSATDETRRQMADLAIRNLVSFFTTGKAVTPVSL